MLSPDSPAAGVPRFLRDVVVLPNKFGLSDTAERKMPEHIVDQIENAPSKNMSFDRADIIVVWVRLDPEKPS
jgi:hypothetical protein